MKLQHIKIENLKTTTINVRKKGGKDIGDLLPSIRSLGLLQPLLVRANCEGYEIVAGQRRYHALKKLAEETDEASTQFDAVPCIIMDEGDDAKAIEASLAENIARLPMDEIDQYKAFAALAKEGKGVADIAAQFGITERLVTQRLAIANLISPILTAYRKEDIRAGTIRILTMASKRQQKAWLELYKSEEEHAPEGYALKSWLFGGANIATENALFDLDDYQGGIVSDLFGEDQYFDDASKFWELQNTAIAKAKEQYLINGWKEAIVLDVGEYFPVYDYVDTLKEEDGKVYIASSRDGEVTFYEGQLPRKEAQAKLKAAKGEETTANVRPELTKPMQNYLDLHRHSAVRTELIGHGDIALRLAVAQIIAGSSLWTIHADPQKANNDSIAESLATNKAEDKFAEERQAVRELLGWSDDVTDTIVPAKNDWQRQNDLHEILAKLIELDDATVTRILTFTVAESLPAGSTTVEVLGNLLSIDMADHWKVDDTFLDLHRDKEAINAMLKHIGGKRVADGNISATAKVQKKIIADYLDGTRQPQKKDWQPRYMDFPMRAYSVSPQRVCNPPSIFLEFLQELK